MKKPSNDRNYENKDSLLGHKFKRKNNFDYQNDNDKFQNKNYNNKNNNIKHNNEPYYNNKVHFSNNYRRDINNYYNRSSNYSKKNHNNNNSQNFNSINNSEQTISLPILSKKDEIIKTIKSNRVIIISGNTGCGKSTQVPQYILENFPGSKILITQPRRIAAISIAKRLSFERNTKLGELIGYHVSMIPEYSLETKIFVKTTGVFLEELLHSNDKNEFFDYSHVIIDEVHERDLFVDLVLVLLKNYFKKNPDSNKKLILMSATISELQFANYLNDINMNKDVPIIRINEKWHEVLEFYIEDIIGKIVKSKKIKEDLIKRINDEKANCVSLSYEFPVYSESLFPIVAGIIETIKDNKGNSGILIFIPGFGEIQDLQEYLTDYFSDNDSFEFLILHSLVTDDEQEKVFKINRNKRKIILATNIAESSITISNIDYVIDFCLVKQTKFDENQNTSILQLKWCSKASCHQRKGRTGRVNKGYYFKLITKDLYKQFQAHQEPEILRTPLETPILKLKIYDEKQEPEIILSQSMDPPSQETIINTIFRLERMGAITDINFNMEEETNCENNYIETIDSNGVRKRKKIEKDNKINYSSGKITNVGEIFAQLPIDIKYSRLIVLSFALGQIDVGITLAAILSQERTLFLNSNKCNRISLYDSKNYFCNNQNCDFIACYIAYKFFCSKYRKDIINEKIDFDTRLNKRIKNYNEIKTFTKERNLDFKAIKEIIRLENDLKKRLSAIGMYSKHFEPKGEDLKSVNFIDKKASFILKIILSGTFYNQIFAPEYDNFQGVDNDINRTDNLDNRPQQELYTIRLYHLQNDEQDKLLQIFNAIVPGKISSNNYDENSEQLTIIFNDVESIRKILFITSASLKRNREIPVFKYVDKKIDEDKEGINRNYVADKTAIINLGKEPEYLYNLHFYDIYIGGEIFLEKDSINLTYIIKDHEELNKSKFVTDSYINKSGNNFKKFARFTSLLPRTQMFDKYMMLIFGPKFEMIAQRMENDNNDIFSHYTGFQSFEFFGTNYFDYDLGSSGRKKFVRNNYIKLDYLITNYHLKIINEIRYLINQMIKFKFESRGKNVDLSKIEFDELKDKYVQEADNILKKIKNLLDEPKYRYINDKKYQELFDYIQNYKRKTSRGEDNKMIKGEVNQNEIVQNEEKKTNEIYMGYINEIKELKTKINEKDFLQFHDPLIIKGEYHLTQSKMIKIKAKEDLIYKMFKDYNNILNRIKSLIYSKEAWLCCSKCFKDICSVNIPEKKNEKKGENKGEYAVLGAFLTCSLKTVGENKDKINKEDIESFKNKLYKNKIKFDDLFCCPTGDTIVGYIRNNQRYVYYGSNLVVKYPDLSEEIVEEEEYINGFRRINQKVKEIMIEKEKKEFKKQICCKLCGFTITKNVKEFKDHLNTKFHKEKMEELKKEFML